VSFQITNPLKGANDFCEEMKSRSLGVYIHRDVGREPFQTAENRCVEEFEDNVG